MVGTDVVFVVGALAAGVAAGLVAHEWAHAVALRAGGVDYTVEFFPGRNGTVLGLLSSCPWAQVRPLPTAGDPGWVLRVAALAPVTLVIPVVVAGFGGHVPAGGVSALTALTIGWLACAIPSPQDFSVVFYAHTLLEEAAVASPGRDESNPAAVDESTPATP